MFMLLGGNEKKVKKEVSQAQSVKEAKELFNMGRFPVVTTQQIERAVMPLLKRYRAEKAILFGSYARNEATPQSDIDLVITGGTEFDPTDVFCIADELYRTLGKNVDVYELREIDTGSDFYHTIHREGVQIA